MKIVNEFGKCEYEFEDGYVHIYNLYIKPKFRKQGRAKKLLQIAIDSIRKTGWRKEIQIVAVPQEGSISKEKLISFYKSMKLDVYPAYLQPSVNLEQKALQEAEK